MPVALETIRPLAAHEIDRLEPLWVALHAHHVRAEPRLARMAARSPRDSWRRRRAAYLRWTEDPETFVLVAQTGDELVGYAFVTVVAGYSVWDSGPRAAQLETLSIAPAMRGRGIGERLLAAVRRRLAGAGIETLLLSVACANDGARRFYARHGFRPAELLLVGPTATAGARTTRPRTRPRQPHRRTRKATGRDKGRTEPGDPHAGPRTAETFRRT